MSPVSATTRSPEWSENEHVTIWNRVEKRKVAGNAAPLRRNLQKYLEKHPECEVYMTQNDGNIKNRKRRKSTLSASNESVASVESSVHVPIWNVKENRKIAGNAAPLAKNLTSYLASHPEAEVYDGQDMRKGKVPRRMAVVEEVEVTGAMTESNPENRIPIDPWLSESVTSEEILSDDDHWEAIHNNFNNWGAERNSDFGLPETDMSLCFTSLQPLEAPEFDASVYL